MGVADGTGGKLICFTETEQLLQSNVTGDDNVTQPHAGVPLLVKSIVAEAEDAPVGKPLLTVQ
jgi:hypothetical protein